MRTGIDVCIVAVDDDCEQINEVSVDIITRIDSLLITAAIKLNRGKSQSFAGSPVSIYKLSVST
jgi:hypothetical protein